jgi:uncharacterized protein YyaL (SSP411 family)
VLLVDIAEVLKACIAVAQASGEGEYLERARTVRMAAEKQLWAEDGGFWDHARAKQDIAALRYRDKPFDTNAEMARALNDLALLTGDKSHRAGAERILALLSPQAGRYGVGAANFALASDEFFDAPTRIIIVGKGPDAAQLRATALRVRVAQRRVLSLPDGGRIAQFNFPVTDRAVVYVVNPQGASAALKDAAQLEKALTVKG